MSLKKTLLLGIIVLAALLYIYKVELPTETAKQNARRLVAGLTGEQLSKVEVSSPKGPFVLVNSSPQPVDAANDATPKKNIDSAELLKKWHLESVKDNDLDSGALNALLSAVLDFKADEPIPAADLSSDMSVYGLKDPQARIKVTAGSTTTEVLLGKKNEYLQKRYAQFAGQSDVYLVGDQLFLASNKPQNDFRSKTPVQFVDADIKVVSVNGPSGSIKLERSDSGWQITQPQNLKAADSSISELTTALRSMHAADFVDGDNLKLSDYGLDKPTIEAVVDFKDPSKQPQLNLKVATVAQPAPTPAKDAANSKDKKEAPPTSISYLMIQGKPTIFKLAADPTASIKIGVYDYREKQLFKFATDQANSITISRKDGELKLSKVEGQWKVLDKVGDETFIRQLLATLSNLSASSFPQAEEDFGFNSPTLKIVVGFEGKDQKPRTLVIGKDASAGYFAGVDELKEPFIINAEDFKRINVQQEVLVKAATPAPSGSPQASPQP